ncbi:hypothetical protein JM18_003195 [Phytophthora kernoviae]|uniref:Rhodanese domain-containing protein n=1 Tax=Phytophthora kernoviae TaxID=325452 RepID=A0A921VBF4_9STRA|nr:hypothetical protein JM18_003195 [Phytophthora kernoviae]
MVDTFRDTFDALDEILEQHEVQHDGQKPSEVMMYCTGGIRCEKVGAYLAQYKGVSNVQKLHGGIVNYMRFLKENKKAEAEARASSSDAVKIEEEVSLFKGKNFVFDQRCVGQLTESEECIAQLFGACSEACKQEFMKMEAMTTRQQKEYRKKQATLWMPPIPNALSKYVGKRMDATPIVRMHSRRFTASSCLRKSISDSELQNDYVYAHSSSLDDDTLLRELREETSQNWPKAEQLIDEMQGKFLSFLVQSVQAKRVLEIGCFTGYSALCLANGLPTDGSLVTCDVDADTMQFAQSYFDRSSRAKQITAINQDGMEYLNTLTAGPKGPFDFIFVDANKRKYQAYYDAILEHKLLSPTGLLVFDNTLFRGRVAAYADGLASNKERIARGLAEFNSYAASDPRSTNVVMPFWDGLSLIRQHNMCGLVTRMRMHLARKCPNCPTDIKAEMFEVDLNRNVELITTTTQASVGAVRAATRPPDTLRAKKPRQLKKKTPPQPQTPESAEKAELDGYVARAVFGSAQPVSAVENAAFVKLLKRMNSNYEPPSAYALSTSVLDQEYTTAQTKLRADVLDATTVYLGVESLATTMQKRSLVSCTINTPKPSVFAIESTDGMPHTPEVLIDKVDSILTEIGTDRVSVIVMDTSNSMKQTALALQRKYPDITILPSCAHAMNAMMTEMLARPPIASTLNTCRDIAAFFAYNCRARAAIARVSGQVQLVETVGPLGDPDDESPSGLLDCLFNVERNRHALDILLAESDTLSVLSTHVKERITNLGFWEGVSMYTGLFEPFVEVLKVFESDYPLLSTFYHRFTLLWGHLEKYADSMPKLQHIMSAHWQKLQHPAMYTAYLLDPRFPPSSLSAEAMSEVPMFLKRSSDANAYTNIVSELTRFTGRTGLFADDAIWESAHKCSPIQWWKGFIGSSCPNLQKVALRTLCFPASCGLSKSKREMLEKILVMNAKYMNEDQASKAAVVYLNTTLSSVEDGVANETIV